MHQYNAFSALKIDNLSIFSKLELDCDEKSVTHVFILERRKREESYKMQ